MAIQCKRCAKKIDRYDDYLLCRGKCNSNFHLNCVSVSAGEYTRLRTSGEVKSWNCDSCKQDVTSNNELAEALDRVDDKTHDTTTVCNIEIIIAREINKVIHIINETITNPLKADIKMLINENRILSEEIKSLKDSIEENYKKNKNNSTTDGAIGLDRVDLEEKKIENHAKQSPRRDNSTDDKVIDLRSDNKSEKIIETYRSVLKDTGAIKKINNPDKNEKNVKKKNVIANDTHGNNDFTLVVNKKKKFSDNKTEANDKVQIRNRKSLVRGVGDVLDLKGVERYMHRHVCRLSPETKAEDIIKYLKPKIPNIMCDKLQSRQPSIYSSFKVSVPARCIDIIDDSNIWPEGVLVNRFFHHKEVKERMT